MISREFRRLAATEVWNVSQRSLQICIPLLRIGRKPKGKNHWKENYRVKAGFKIFGGLFVRLFESEIKEEILE